jgi:putative hydrolase of HD superfamily
MDEMGDPDDLEALARAFALKDERRTGWELRGIYDPETVAGHSWGVALLCLVYSERAGIDPDHALRLAVIHDIAEAETGDVATRVDPEKQTVSTEEKEAREREAIADLADPFDFLSLWEEYEARESPEARFVKDMDLIDMCLQALVYEREERYEKGESDAFERFEDLDEFFATAEPRLTTDVGRELFSEIHGRCEAVR